MRFWREFNANKCRQTGRYLDRQAHMHMQWMAVWNGYRVWMDNNALTSRLCVKMAFVLYFDAAVLYQYWWIDCVHGGDIGHPEVGEAAILGVIHGASGLLRPRQILVRNCDTSFDARCPFHPLLLISKGVLIRRPCCCVAVWSDFPNFCSNIIDLTKMSAVVTCHTRDCQSVRSDRFDNLFLRFII